MIVFCEECGRKYQVDPGKIRGREATFKCKSCNHLIVVKKPERDLPKQTAPKGSTKKPADAASDRKESESEDKGKSKPVKRQAPGGPLHNSNRFGLRGKMMILFLFVPVSLMIAAGGFSLWQFNKLALSLADESTGMGASISLKDAEIRSKQLAVRTRNVIIGVWGGVIILIGAIVSLYGYRLSGRIQSLANMAERISVGELAAEIDIKSRDEIGKLSDAFSRMQDSVRIAIERLHRQRIKKA